MAGNVSGAREVVQRHQFADYLNIGTSEKPNWVLMGVGFTTLDETFGAESESEKYVCEPSSSSSVVSYTSVFPFEAMENRRYAEQYRGYHEPGCGIWRRPGNYQ